MENYQKTNLITNVTLSGDWYSISHNGFCCGLNKSYGVEPKVGDKLTVNVVAADGYGEYNPELVQVVPKHLFGGVENIEAGMQFHAQTDYGMQVVTVAAVEGDEITVDGNHPLASQHLNFDVEIMDIREVSSEELEHGHVHGAGGHQH